MNKKQILSLKAGDVVRMKYGYNRADAPEAATDILLAEVVSTSYEVASRTYGHPAKTTTVNDGAKLVVRELRRIDRATATSTGEVSETGSTKEWTVPNREVLAVWGEAEQARVMALRTEYMAEQQRLSEQRAEARAQREADAERIRELVPADLLEGLGLDWAVVDPRTAVRLTLAELRAIVEAVSAR